MDNCVHQTLSDAEIREAVRTDRGSAPIATAEWFRLARLAGNWVIGRRLPVIYCARHTPGAAASKRILHSGRQTTIPNPYDSSECATLQREAYCDGTLLKGEAAPPCLGDGLGNLIRWRISHALERHSGLCETTSFLLARHEFVRHSEKLLSCRWGA
jgi:hypothetical protein